jgi:hypothetical protein
MGHALQHIPKAKEALNRFMYVLTWLQTPFHPLLRQSASPVVLIFCSQHIVPEVDGLQKGARTDVIALSAPQPCLSRVCTAVNPSDSARIAIHFGSDLFFIMASLLSSPAVPVNSSDSCPLHLLRQNLPPRLPHLNRL